MQIELRGIMAIPGTNLIYVAWCFFLMLKLCSRSEWLFIIDVCAACYDCTSDNASQAKTK